MLPTRLAWAALALVAVAACSEADANEGTPREAAIVEQVVRSVVDAEPVDPEQPDAVPIAYVIGVEGTISIEVQASVAASLVDEIDVRFADERSEAFDESEEQRVRDGGVLIVVGEIPPEGRTVDLEVDRYVAAEDRHRIVMSLRFRSPDWSVTSTTIPPPIIE